MDIAAQYAEALHQAVAHKPAEASSYLKNLRASLKSRGHERLFPRIFKEYEKITLREARREEQRRVTPEVRRTRTLLELYRTLIANR